MTKLVLRVLASGVALVLVAASCGASTGEGAPAAPAASAAPATQAQAATAAAPAQPQFLVVMGDTIRGNLGLNKTEILTTAPGIHCTQQNRFPQGGRIVWRMKVMDPATGKYMDNKQIASFTITYPDGKTDKLAYGGHGGTKEKPADMLWAVGYTVPNDYPTGLFPVKIVATDLEGRTGTFDQFKVDIAQLTIVPKGMDYPESHEAK
ncbi:MAG: hypothetical protein KGN00_01375 [Chloroflexota bacterium]|nr:hypothetical protein [Chloroflexota bacterium]MDE3192313.1 hypothetical protein [Chloroflexota bacterium]